MSSRARNLASWSRWLELLTHHRGFYPAVTCRHRLRASTGWRRTATMWKGLAADSGFAHAGNMLTQGAAMRIAESAAGWLRRRDPKAWLTLAIVVLTDDGQSHHVVPRVEAVNMLEKARAKASQAKFKELERDLAVGIDLVKAAAPIEVPVVAFFEREDRPIETGVITLRLPTPGSKRPRGEA